MLNIAICDDDDLIAHQIESVLHNIGDEENVKIDTDVFYSGNDLVKPIDRDSFAQIFLEANQRICSRNHFFSFKYKSQEYKVLCKEILYFESKARQINIHVRDGNKYVFNGKLLEVEKGLSSGKVTFLRIHQSYLVNYLLIKSRSKSNVTLINGEVLPISEDRQKEFSKEYGRLLRGEIYV